ncbi:MAG: hypothetical protein RLZZ410_751 [Pseudomonadota bacterium]|jgi:hypothetical protein
MQIRSQKDFASGLMFVVVGLLFSYVATTYNMGTTAKMGPGFFPYWLGLLLAILGAIVTMTSMSNKAPKDQIAKWDWPSVLWVTGSVVIFGVVLAYLGLMLSVLVLVFISAMASHEFHWKGTIVNAVILNLIAYVAFIWGLKLQFQVWPSFFTA